MHNNPKKHVNADPMLSIDVRLSTFSIPTGVNRYDTFTLPAISIM